MTIANHTLCIYSSNTPGILHRITVLFTRRKLNVESLTVSETETVGVSRFTIVIRADYDTAELVGRQIKRIVDVHEVFVCSDDEIISREVAMFKVQRDPELQHEIEKFGLRVVHEHDDAVVLEQTGTEDEINTAVLTLKRFGLSEFVRSGRIGVRRDGVTFSGVRIEEPRSEVDASNWI